MEAVPKLNLGCSIESLWGEDAESHRRVKHHHWHMPPSAEALLKFIDGCFCLFVMLQSPFYLPTKGLQDNTIIHSCHPIASFISAEFLCPGRKLKYFLYKFLSIFLFREVFLPVKLQMQLWEKRRNFLFPNLSSIAHQDMKTF